MIKLKRQCHSSCLRVSPNYFGEINSFQQPYAKSRIRVFIGEYKRDVMATAIESKINEKKKIKSSMVL